MYISSIRFYETWFELAENRRNDEERLAFYDTIFNYAFKGTRPKYPEKKAMTQKEKVVMDAYLIASPILNKSMWGSVGGKSGTGEAKRRVGSANGKSKKNQKE